MKKKILILSLSVLLLVSCIVVVSFAAEGRSTDYYEPLGLLDIRPNMQEYTPSDTTFWGRVQRIVNQGPDMVKSYYTVGDVFYDSWNGKGYLVTLVDIAEDGSCTFMFDAVQNETLLYEFESHVANIHTNIIPGEFWPDEDTLVYEYWPIVIGGLGDQYYLIDYYPPENGETFVSTFTAEFSVDYHDPDFPIRHVYIDGPDIFGFFPLGEDLSSTELSPGGNCYYLEFSLGDSGADSSHPEEVWAELVSSMDVRSLNEVYGLSSDSLSFDLQQYAKKLRLPSLKELGICDPSSEDLLASNVWDLYRKDLILNDDGETVALSLGTVFEHPEFSGMELVEHVFHYALHMGAPNGLWLWDVDHSTDVYTYPSRYYVDASGELHVCPVEYPTSSLLFGDVRPVFTISPQN